MRSTVATPRKRAGGKTTVSRRVVSGLGGRFSTELGIDVDRDDSEVERWFIAATLFGSRISSTVAERTFRVLSSAGLDRIVDAQRFSWEELVDLLDQGGYARYDSRMATRLHALADVVAARYHGRAAAIGRAYTEYEPLRRALGDLPGWGPVTIQLFLRELRGVWAAAQTSLDQRTETAARHLGLIDAPPGRSALFQLFRLAGRAQLDPRDLEGALLRLALAHHDRWEDCPGGPDCIVLVRSEPG